MRLVRLRFWPPDLSSRPAEPAGEGVARTEEVRDGRPTPAPARCPQAQVMTRGVVFVHSCPGPWPPTSSGRSPTRSAAGSPSTGPRSRSSRAACAPSCPGPAPRARRPRSSRCCTRGRSCARQEVTEEPTATTEGPALQRHPDARDLPATVGIHGDIQVPRAAARRGRAGCAVRRPLETEIAALLGSAGRRARAVPVRRARVPRPLAAPGGVTPDLASLRDRRPRPPAVGAARPCPAGRSPLLGPLRPRTRATNRKGGRFPCVSSS